MGGLSRIGVHISLLFSERRWLKKRLIATNTKKKTLWVPCELSSDKRQLAPDSSSAPHLTRASALSAVILQGKSHSVETEGEKHCCVTCQKDNDLPSRTSSGGSGRASNTPTGEVEVTLLTESILGCLRMYFQEVGVGMALVKFMSWTLAAFSRLT